MLTSSGAGVRRRRDAAIGTIELLERRTAVLELKETLTEYDRQSALRMNALLGSVTADFKNYHFTLIDSIENEDEAKAEQAVLQEHELKIMELVDRLGNLMVVPPKERPITDLDLMRKRINQVEKSYRMIKGQFDDHGPDMDIYALRGVEERIQRFELQFQDINKDLLSVDDAEGLEERTDGLEQLLHNLKIEVKRLAGSKERKPPVSASEAMNMSGINLPRIKVPTFEGNILNWQFFWEQFDSAIHSKPQLNDSDKLTYLRDALKDGPARYVIEGLAQTAGSYQEAVRCLKDRYDRPRLIYHEHVRSILQAPNMKANNGRELRKLYDVCQQHIRAVKLAEQYDLDTFLTIAIELKLDEATKLKWMEFSNDSQTTPPHEELLKFLDLQARHFESVHSERKPQTTTHKSYAVTVEDECVVCSRESHPLASCSHFQRMAREERWDLIKRDARCKNCLKTGHMASKCRSPPMCKRCHKYHHTLLHIETDPKTEETKDVNKDKTYAASSKLGKEVLLMTCRVKVIAPDGTVTQARALLDSASSTSLISDQLAKKLRLPRRPDNSNVNGVAGYNVRTKGTVSFKVAGVRDGKPIEVEASVLPKVTDDLPTIPVSSVTRWKHLSDLELADPSYGIPARVDILLGGKVFSKTVLHGRRFGPTGAPSAFKTCFGWVLTGETSGKSRQCSTRICGVALVNNSRGKRKTWSEWRSSGVRGMNGNRVVSAGGMLAPE